MLIAFCERIMGGLRTTDLLFRYGGDEFVLILQGIDDPRGPALVQHLLNDITASPIPGEPPIRIGFSAGISYFPTDGESSKDLLKAADKRVYRAKRDGRGRVESE